MTKQTEYVEKPRLPVIKGSADAKINARLTGHFAKYSSGSILMSATRAAFATDGVKGTVSVDIGGTVIEVGIGTGDDRRTWNVNIADIVDAVFEIDKNYQEGK